MTEPLAYGRPALPDDLFVVVGWRDGLGPLLAERWRRMDRRVVLVLPREPRKDAPIEPGLRIAVLDRLGLSRHLGDPGLLLDAARAWGRPGRRLHVPSTTGLHVLDLRPGGADDILATLGALGRRPGRVVFLSDPRVLGRVQDATPRSEEAPPDPQTPELSALVDAEAIARQSRERQRWAVALRVPPFLFGPGLQPLTPLGYDLRLPERLLRHDPILWASGLTPTQPLHVEDLALAIDALLQLEEPRPLYHLAGPDRLRWGAILDLLWTLSGVEDRPAVEVLRPEELALRKPDKLRAYSDVAWVPVLDDSLAREELLAERRRFREGATEWMRWCLERLSVLGQSLGT